MSACDSVTCARMSCGRARVTATLIATSATHDPYATYRVPPGR